MISSHYCVLSNESRVSCGSKCAWLHGQPCMILSSCTCWVRQRVFRGTWIAFLVFGKVYDELGWSLYGITQEIILLFEISLNILGRTQIYIRSIKWSSVTTTF